MGMPPFQNGGGRLRAASTHGFCGGDLRSPAVCDMGLIQNLKESFRLTDRLNTSRSGAESRLSTQK